MATPRSKKAIVARRLRLAREQAGLTQAQAAELLELHRPSVTEIEAGRRRVTAEELATLSDLYGVSVDWLMGTALEKLAFNDEKVGLAARELKKLSSEDLDRVLRLLSAIRYSRQGDAD